MRLRADSTDARSNSWQLLDGPAFHEFLEAADFGNHQIALVDVPELIEEDVDSPMALESGDRIDPRFGRQGDRRRAVPNSIGQSGRYFRAAPTAAYSARPAAARQRRKISQVT